VGEGEGERGEETRRKEGEGEGRGWGREVCPEVAGLFSSPPTPLPTPSSPERSKKV
jgi:hypothetical protein